MSGIPGGSGVQGVRGNAMFYNTKERDKYLDLNKKINEERVALDGLKSKITDLQTQLKEMDEANDFLVRRASTKVTEDPFVTAEVGANTLTGEYEFEVVKLATATKLSGNANVGAALSVTSSLSGVTINTAPLSTTITDGIFTINGARIEIYDAANGPTAGVDASVLNGGSMEDLLNAIGTATGGAVTATYSEVTDKISLTSGSVIQVGTGADTSNFLYAAKLIGNNTTSVESESALGGVSLSKNIVDANLSTVVTSGTLSINGAEIVYDASTQSLGDVMQQINSSSAGVNIVYDPVSDRFTLKNRGTGSLNISVLDKSGNLMEAMGLVTGAVESLGENAQYKINGGPALNSRSNTFDSSTHGVSGLKVTAQKVGTDTVIVEQDGGEGRKKIEAFIEKYNEVVQFIEKNSKRKVVDLTDPDTQRTVSKTVKGPFTDNSEIKYLKSQLRSFVFAQVTSLASGDIKRMADIGIDFKSDSNEIEIKDSKVLDDALSKESLKVSQLFTDTTDGFAKVFLDKFDVILKKDNTMFDKRKENLDKQFNTNAQEMARLKAKNEKAQRDMEMQQAKIEMAQQEMQRVIGQLRQFGG